MTKELQKRIITSIILILFAIFCIFVNRYIFMIVIIVISYLSFSETSSLIYKIIKRVDSFNWLLFNSIALFYVFAVFAVSAIGIYIMYNQIFFFFILSICIFSDIGGYVIGKNIGGKKLTKISPNKTISGSIGSFCFSVIPLFIFYNLNSSKYFFSIENFLICLEVSLVCQLGDLFVSHIKRKANVKDTGKVLPGHGGILDRIDGIIFAIPFAFINQVGFDHYFESWVNVFYSFYK